MKHSVQLNGATTHATIWNGSTATDLNSFLMTAPSAQAGSQHGIPFDLNEYFGSNDYFSPFLSLGGYQSGHGNEADICDWPEWPLDSQASRRKMLLCIGCEVHTLGITYFINENGTVNFGVKISADY